MNKRRLLISVLLLALGLSLPACGAAPAPEPTVPAEEYYTVRLDNTPYNLEAPALPEEGTPGLAKDSVGLCVDKEGDYLKLSFSGGEEAWIHSWYLSATDDALQRQRELERLEACLASVSYQAAEGGETPCVCTAAAGLRARSGPSPEAEALMTLPLWTPVTVLGRDGDFDLCRLEDGSLVYCAAEYLSADTGYAELPGAVDLRRSLPELKFDLRFASENNVAGEALYPAIPLLEEKTAGFLAAAQEVFRNGGYGIKLYDAYRPAIAQQRLYALVPDSRFFTDPRVGTSWHLLGRAVDITLFDLETGEDLEMPTPVYSFTDEACRDSSGQWSPEAQKNVQYMTDVMYYAGFDSVDTEWWHFNCQDEGEYMDPNLDYSQLTMRSLAEPAP